MQSVQLCVWVIFIFCQTQQVVRRHTIELGECQNRKGAMSFAVSSASYFPSAARDRPVRSANSFSVNLKSTHFYALFQPFGYTGKGVFFR